MAVSQLVHVRKRVGHDFPCSCDLLRRGRYIASKDKEECGQHNLRPTAQNTVSYYSICALAQNLRQREQLRSPVPDGVATLPPDAFPRYKRQPTSQSSASSFLLTRHVRASSASPCGSESNGVVRACYGGGGKRRKG